MECSIFYFGVLLCLTFYVTLLQTFHFLHFADDKGLLYNIRYVRNIRNSLVDIAIVLADFSSTPNDLFSPIIEDFMMDLSPVMILASAMDYYKSIIVLVMKPYTHLRLQITPMILSVVFGMLMDQKPKKS